MSRFFDWIFRTIVFYLKFFIFLAVFAILAIYGTIHAALFGGPIMPDDAWFFAKILFLILLPFALAISMKGKAPFFIGLAASILLACNVSWGTYTHAPQFREAKLYSVEDGKLVVPEENRGLFMRDCGHITNERLKDSCQTIVYCQSYDAAAFERMGCGELLTRKTSPALLDMALTERDAYEYGQR